MLSVHLNEQLLQLSNKMLKALTPLRNKKALIPAWAANDPQRRTVFYRYGSPSVLNYYKPHFSVFDRQKKSIQLDMQLKRLIVQFSEIHPTEVKATTYSIGVGIADSQGQIIKELAEFKLD